MESPGPDGHAARWQDQSRVNAADPAASLRLARLLTGPPSEAEMIACFLGGELSSKRFGKRIRAVLAAMHASETLLTQPDLTDPDANAARREILASTRGYGENQSLFEGFPLRVKWSRARLSPADQAGVRYLDYSYWSEVSGGTRRPANAARRIQRGERAFGVSNARFVAAAAAVRRGDTFPPLILVGVQLDDLVCLEGNLRLTGYALAGFPRDVDCLVGTSPDMRGWAR